MDYVDNSCGRYAAEIYADEELPDSKKVNIEINPARMAKLNPSMAFDIAYALEKGIDGFKKDYQTALELFKILAFNNNEPRAYNNLGWMYQCGFGVAQDMDQALEYYKQAADLGDTAAMVNIGNYHESLEEYGEAGKWYLLAAIGGNNMGALNCGNLYHWGWGVEKNYEVAYKIFMRCYRQRYKRGACYYLGIYAEQGLVSDVDFELAAKYYKEGGEAGDPECYIRLGALYQEGKGVEKDEKMGFGCFVAAAKMGEPEAYIYMAECLKDGRGVEKNKEHARKLLQKTKNAGFDVESFIKTGIRECTAPVKNR